MLSTAQLSGALAKSLRAYTQSSLLLLDELGNLPADERSADLLFQVAAARHEPGSIATATNRAFKDWRAILHFNDSLAAALIERLMHRGEAILIQGASDRMNDTAEHIQPHQ